MRLMQDSKDHEESGNMISPKEQNKALITGPKEVEIWKLPDKEFKIVIWEILSENTGKQLNKIGK